MGSGDIVDGLVKGEKVSLDKKASTAICREVRFLALGTTEQEGD